MPEDLDAIQRRDKAIDLILQSYPSDGAQFKQWYLDQVLRVLAGDEYANLIDCYEGSGDGMRWETGLDPNP